MNDRFVIDARRRTSLYHGWLVVAAAFLVALFGWGLGFYGPGIYLVALQQRHGWSIAALSSAITAYYVLGAGLLFFCVGPLFERQGARRVVIAGAVAMAGGVIMLTLVTRPWHVYVAFAVMSLGWAAMSGAAINIIVAPWFDRRRGLAVSWALNGGSAGGMIIAPLLTLLIARVGLAAALDAVGVSMLVILVPVAALVLRARRVEERDPADAVGAADGSARPASVQRTRASSLRIATGLRDKSLVTISVPFALGLTAQVGFLTHQIAFLSPIIGTVPAAWAVSMTTAAAVLGRVATGLVVDRVDRRAAACANFLVQVLAMAILAAATVPEVLYLGCVLFGLGVGNMVSLPGLIVQQEFPKEHFARVVSLVVAINQFSFAFGPGLLGRLQQSTGGYAAALVACVAMDTVAAVIVVWPVLGRPGRTTICEKP